MFLFTKMFGSEAHLAPLFSVGTGCVFPREKIDLGLKLMPILKMSGARPLLHL